MEGPFNFETLSAQEGLEKKSRSLTQLQASFFRYVVNYLEQLEAQFRKEQEKNPSSKKAAFISDELRNATNKAEELWKTREKKIAQFAMVHARKDPTPALPENLTRDESAFYGQLLALFREQWKRYVPGRTGESATPAAAPAPVRPTTAPSIVQPQPPSPAPEASASSNDLQTIRALVDIPPFVGTDNRTYRIKKGEVVSLPRKIAGLLKERNQALPIG